MNSVDDPNQTEREILERSEQPGDLGARVLDNLAVDGEPTSNLPQVSAFVREAVARMQPYPRFFSQEALDDFSAYEANGGPVISGNPDGQVPDNLEDDGNE